MTTPIPYKIATLCEIRDQDNRVLLLHRHKHPNRHLYSPIGGKLEQHIGESPADSALREIHEEAGLSLAHQDLHLLGIISETAFQPTPDTHATHWLMFWFRVLPPIDPALVPPSFDEGTLEWFHDHQLDQLPLPETDRTAIWPTVRTHTNPQNAKDSTNTHGFFALHLDCTTNPITHTLQQSHPPALPT